VRIVTSLAEWAPLRAGLAGSIGLVPTMGALHEGHLSLVRRARSQNDSVVVWIFVNPKQFGAGEDFRAYPRDLRGDAALVQAAGADCVLAPGVEDVYPEGFQTQVQVDELSRPLEGALRPGHFRGVATVVAKMFCLTQPRRAYFGQKDAQQCIVVQRMARDLGFPLDIVVCPTVREPDGLAMSSRNVYLDPAERKAAAVLYRALAAAERAARAGERDGAALRALMAAELAREPLGTVEYVSVANLATLEEYARVTGPALLSLAVRFGRARLIDNIPLPDLK
jgi:pantoate--beta-alanine ligase